jgi:hypothetical protein
MEGKARTQSREAVMTHFAARPVVSGRPYPVVQVAAGEPARLEDFVGNARFVVDLDGDRLEVCGFGREVDAGVRFYQKDAEGFGRDVRVWLVRRLDDGSGFSAVHAVR